MGRGGWVLFSVTKSPSNFIFHLLWSLLVLLETFFRRLIILVLSVCIAIYNNNLHKSYYAPGTVLRTPQGPSRFVFTPILRDTDTAALNLWRVVHV